MRNLFAVLLLLVFVHTAAANEADLQIAAALLGQDKTTEARAKLEQIIDDEPEHPQALLLLASAYLKENQVSQAVSILEAKRHLLVGFPSYHNNLAYAYFYKGKDKQAIEALKDGIKLHPAYDTVYENLSIIYAFMAKKAFEKAIDENTAIQRELPKLKLYTQLELTKPTISETTPKIAPSPADLTKEKALIKATLSSWANAWSAQNANGYLDHYSDRFKTPEGVSFSAWQDFRRDRVTAPSFIKVELSQFDTVISADGSLASVHFLQHYRSNTLNDSVVKHMVLEKNATAWKILSEYVAN